MPTVATGSDEIVFVGTATTHLPLSDFRDAVTRAGLADRVRYLDRGESLPLGGSRDPVRRGA